jgi:hypothetical protein
MHEGERLVEIGVWHLCHAQAMAAAVVLTQISTLDISFNIYEVWVNIFCQWLWRIKSFVFSLAIEIGIEKFHGQDLIPIQN